MHSFVLAEKFNKYRCSYSNGDICNVHLIIEQRYLAPYQKLEISGVTAATGINYQPPSLR